MTKEQYLTLSAASLKDLAKTRGIKGSYAMKKDRRSEAETRPETGSGQEACRKEDGARKEAEGGECAARRSCGCGSARCKGRGAS